MSRSAKGKRARKPIKPHPQQPQPVVDEAVEAAPAYEYEGEFADVEDYETGLVDERQLQLLMRDWRKGRATQSIWDMITNAYTMLFSMLVIGAMFIGGILSAQRNAAGCTTAGCTTSKTLVPWLMVAAMALLAVSLSKLFGPVIASAAEGFWLLEAPLRRSRLLRRRLWSVLGLAFVVSGLLTGLVSMLLGVSWAGIGLWTLAAGLAASAMTAFAAAQQGAERTLGLNIAQGLVGLATTVVLVMVIGVSVGWLALGLTASLSNQLVWLVLGLGGLAGVASAAVALSRLDVLRRARLVSGGDLLSGMQGAAFALDFGLMRDILTERKYLNRGQVKPSRGRGAGKRALIWRDVQRLVRNPVHLVVLAVSAIIPYATEALGLGTIGSAVTAVIVMFVLVPFFDSLRVVSRTRGLARAFPFDTTGLRSTLTVVPGAVALVWAIVTMPAYVSTRLAEGNPDVMGAMLLSIITGGAAYLGAIRWVSAKSADYSSPMVATGMGALPPGLIFNMVRGFDVIALIMLPLIFGLSPFISIVIGLIVYSFLRSGGLDMEELAEKNAEAKKQLEQARAGGKTPPGQRKQISRTSAKTSPARYTRR